MASNNPNQARLINRLVADLKEFKQNPVDCVTGGPLEDLMTEWHCNALLNGVQYHCVLFIPDDYPFKPPKAELVPENLCQKNEATKPGRKGIEVCLPIFEQFTPGKKELEIPSSGWSPAYSLRPVLCQLLTYLQDSSLDTAHNRSIAKAYKCPDCITPASQTVSAHTVIVKQETEKDKETQQNVKKFYNAEEESVELRMPNSAPSDKYKDAIGFGVTVINKVHSSLRSSCELVSYKDFCEMKSESVEGLTRYDKADEQCLFLPLYLNKDDHWNEFLEICVHRIGKAMRKDEACTVEELLLSIIPNLFSSIVVGIFLEMPHSDENYIRACFVLHRLMLRVMRAYPRLYGMIEDTVQVFIDDESVRTRARCPNIGAWLALLGLSTNNRWNDAAAAYIKESFRRGVMFYVTKDRRLGVFNTDMSYRLKTTFSHTKTGRSLLSFQVMFLDIAWPEGMTKEAIEGRYDEHGGMPSQQMLAEMMDAKRRIDEIHSYPDFFQVLKLEPLSDEDIFRFLIDALQYAIETEGYHMTYGKWDIPLQQYQKSIDLGHITPGVYSRSAGVQIRRLNIREANQ